MHSHIIQPYDNQLIERNMKEESRSRILYINPLSVYNEDEIATVRKNNVNDQIKDFHDYYPNIGKRDSKFAGKIKEIYARCRFRFMGM